jgi:nucleoside-diphosphate-sugar epimerase
MSVMLVTGGAGFIGSHIVDRLIELGHVVRVLDDFSTGRRENLEALKGRFDLLEADVRDMAAVRKAVEGAEIVFHQAALASVPRSIDGPVATNQVNVGGSLNVLVASRDAGVRRVIYASSSSVYGDTPELPKREHMTPRPASPYAVSKLAAEHYCRVFASLYGLACMPLRYFNVFGPRQDPNSQYAAVVPLFVTALLEGRSPVIHGDGEQSRDFTYVANVVDANIAAASANAGNGEVVNIACGSRFTVNELFAMLKKLTGATVEPRHADRRPGDVMHSYADVTKAANLFGFAPRVSFEEGLEQTVAWFGGQP